MFQYNQVESVLSHLSLLSHLPKILIFVFSPLSNFRDSESEEFSKIQKWCFIISFAEAQVSQIRSILQTAATVMQHLRMGRRYSDADAQEAGDIRGGGEKGGVLFAEITGFNTSRLCLSL